MTYNAILNIVHTHDMCLYVLSKTMSVVLSRTEMCHTRPVYTIYLNYEDSFCLTLFFKLLITWAVSLFFVLSSYFLIIFSQLNDISFIMTKKWVTFCVVSLIHYLCFIFCVVWCLLFMNIQHHICIIFLLC